MTRQDYNQRLQQFGQWAIDEHRKYSCDIDGGDIQDKLEELGLIEGCGLEAGCQRSHPHEEMDNTCRLKTEIAVLRNQLAHNAWRKNMIRQSDGGQARIIDEPFIDELKRLYTLSKMTKQEFARSLGISPQYFGDLLLGRRNPSVKVTASIVRSLGLRGGSKTASRYWHRIAAKTHGWDV